MFYSRPFFIPLHWDNLCDCKTSHYFCEGSFEALVKTSAVTMCLLLNNPRHEPWINPINNDLVSGPVQCSCSRPLAFYCRDRCVLENTNCASLGQCLEMNEVMRHY